MKIRSGDQARFIGERPEPHRADDEAPKGKRGDRDGAEGREHKREPEIESSERTVSRCRKGTPKPAAKWLMVTSANAQKPQNTNACARPGSGRSRMTFAWHSTSQKKSQMRRPIGSQLEIGIAAGAQDAMKRLCRSAARTAKWKQRSAREAVFSEAKYGPCESSPSGPASSSSMKKRAICHFRGRWLHWITPLRPAHRQGPSRWSRSTI